MATKSNNRTVLGIRQAPQTSCQHYPEPGPVIEFVINKELLELILEEDVKSFRVNVGSTLGDNYMSIIHAVEVQVYGRSLPHHILIKSYPMQLARRRYIDDTDVFGTEFFFYDQWAPKLAKLSGDVNNLQLCIPEFLGGNRAGIGGRSKFSEINYPQPWANENFIVMNDLRKDPGLKMANRIEGVDAEHATLIVKQLATMHALSWGFKMVHGIDSLASVYPDMMDKTSNSAVTDSFTPLMEMLNEKVMTNIKEGFGSDSPIYIGVKKLYSNNTMNILKRFTSHEGIVEEEIETLLRVPDKSGNNLMAEPWLVACHGDCWTNNVLFEYKPTTNSPVPINAILLDFQGVREACPTTDLAYFLYSSTTTETRRQSESDILRAYYDQFKLVCDVLECKPLPGFSFSTLQRRFRQSKIFGFLIGVALLNIMMKPAEDAIELDDLSGDIASLFGSVMNSGDKNVLWEKRVQAMAKEFYEDGIL